MRSAVLCVVLLLIVHISTFAQCVLTVSSIGNILEHSNTQATPRPKNRSQLQTRSTSIAHQCVWHFDSQEWICDLKLPTISEFVQRMRNTEDYGNATPERSVWFYTNLQTAGKSLFESLEWPVMWLELQQVKHYSIFDGVNMAWLTEQKDFVRGNGALMEDGAFDNGDPDDEDGKQAGKEAYDELVRCYNQATATAALHADAYIFTSKTQDWSPRSIWAETELPALTQNKNIQRIWMVIPDDTQCGQRQLYWERQQHATIKFVRKCVLTDLV